MSRWSPYQDNGGSAVAIAGRDYAAIVADTRLSRGYSILSRNVSKVVKLTDKVCLVSCGMRADIDALHKKMTTVVTMYKFDHGCAPSVEALAQKLSVELYSRRFFPYYALNLLAGISDEDGGAGRVYTYDAIGNTEPKVYGSTGSAGTMMLPVLDMGLQKGRRVDPPTVRACETEMGEASSFAPLDAAEAIKLGVDALTAATERNIHTGDTAEAWLIKASGEVQRQTYSLRKD